MKILIVVDMQNDFVTGVLGTKEAQKIIPNVIKRIKEYKNEHIIFTLDSHDKNYLKSIEGQFIPVPHCLANTEGEDLIPEIKKWLYHNPISYEYIYKNNFGTINLINLIKDKEKEGHSITEIEIIGVCTDICVITNALILRSMDNTTKISINARCCAGTSPEMHGLALKIMKQNCINIIK